MQLVILQQIRFPETRHENLQNRETIKASRKEVQAFVYRKIICGWYMKILFTKILTES
jgi:hypothetical protein